MKPARSWRTPFTSLPAAPPGTPVPRGGRAGAPRCSRPRQSWASSPPVRGGRGSAALTRRGRPSRSRRGPGEGGRARSHHWRRRPQVSLPPTGQHPRQGSPSEGTAEPTSLQGGPMRSAQLCPGNRFFSGQRAPRLPGRVPGDANCGARAPQSWRGFPIAERGAERRWGRTQRHLPPACPPARPPSPGPVTWVLPGVGGGGGRGVRENAGVTLRAAPRHETAAPVLGRGHGPGRRGGKLVESDHPRRPRSQARGLEGASF